ncbi:hypothetical protein K6V64_01060 [Streptococcus suis]|nr:hypothetical protein [Streptococcus suis]HEL9643970.1 hypothetical protein [Streptococcus suis]
MSIVEKIKSQPKTLLATVAIAGVTVGFAGGLGVGKASSSVANNQVQLGNNGQGMIPPGQGGQPGGNGQGMTPPGQGGQPGGKGQGMTPPGQGGQPGGNGQGMTPPDQGNTTDTSNTSSDEINELKKRNQEIQSQIESKNQ